MILGSWGLQENLSWITFTILRKANNFLFRFLDFQWERWMQTVPIGKKVLMSILYTNKTIPDVSCYIMCFQADLTQYNALFINCNRYPISLLFFALIFCQIGLEHIYMYTYICIFKLLNSFTYSCLRLYRMRSRWYCFLNVVIF